MYSNLTDLQTILKPQQKYTFWKFGEMGFPYAIHGTFNSLQINPYAQHQISYLMRIKPKGKRNLREIRLNDSQTPFIIWEGWQKIDTKMFREEIPQTPGALKVQNSWLSFSHKYIDIALSSYNTQPLFFQDYYIVPAEREEKNNA